MSLTVLPQASLHTPVGLVRVLHEAGSPRTGLLLFDSTQGAPTSCPRVSIVCVAPVAWMRETEEPGVYEDHEGRGIPDPVAWLRAHYRPAGDRSPGGAKGVPFCGGLAGVLGFEFAWELDRIEAACARAIGPSTWVGVYQSGALYDHDTCQWCLAGDAQAACWATLQRALGLPAAQAPAAHTSGDLWGMAQVGGDQEAYEAGVRQAKEAIVARGDLFEVNVTARWRSQWQGDGALGLYEAMAGGASGAYFGFLDAGTFALASVSPEQFLKVSGGQVTTSPIKGSAPRAPEDPGRDAELAQALAESPKDRAENVMIVDLMRNDLTQTCLPGSVEVTQLCEVESFAGIHHLVSRIQGRLDMAQCDSLDVLLSCFPAGSITGAPKLRAIAHIAQTEAVARGAYTGSMFYLGRGGDLEANVLIRTAQCFPDGTVYYGAGGAVVSDSDPKLEYEEALLKTRPLRLLLPGGGP